jgi:uncharacterized membrane protein
MMTVIPILAAIIVAGMGMVIALWFLRKRRQKLLADDTSSPITQSALSFRWKYVALPVGVLAISLLLAIVFYSRLPEEAAYHFTDGTPDKWLDREALIAWGILPQFFLTLLSFGIVWVTLRISSHFRQPAGEWLGSLLTLMGNMVALPQIVLSFAMLDIFSYNAYGKHLMPLWLFALIVMALGAVVLGILFTIAIRRVLATGKGKT